jgi:hypothetical protein
METSKFQLEIKHDPTTDRWTATIEDDNDNVLTNIDTLENRIMWGSMISTIKNNLK